MLEGYNINNYDRADKEFVEIVKKILLKNNNKYSMMELVRKTGLSKTQVSLSLDELLSKNEIECIKESNKKYYYAS